MKHLCVQKQKNDEEYDNLYRYVKRPEQSIEAGAITVISHVQNVRV
jgi:hypothetical protein